MRSTSQIDEKPVYNPPKYIGISALLFIGTLFVGSVMMSISAGSI